MGTLENESHEFRNFMIQPMLAPHAYNKKRERNRKEMAFRSRQTQSLSASVFQNPVGRMAGQVPVQGNKDKKKNVRGNRAFQGIF